MGDIADDMECGFQCSWCGVCFEEEHGYPVACDSCWREAMKNMKCKTAEELTKKTGVQKHTELEL